VRIEKENFVIDLMSSRGAIPASVAAIAHVGSWSHREGFRFSAYPRNYCNLMRV